jgi:nucleoside-diphosphate-sugar epimerase
MSNTVLVTGGLGLVGSETVKRLAADGRRVVATDLDIPANRKKAAALPQGVDARWADLTDPEQVQRLISEVSPAAIIHLAAVIPPLIYRNPTLARRVNVEATATVVKVAEDQATPPRFVQASSNAVFGARNPHRNPEILCADDPMRPCDLYSATKAEAEEIVRSSSLDWVVLRFGGVLSTDLSALPLSLDALYFESAADRWPAAQRRRP